MSWTAQCDDPSSNELLVQAPLRKDPPWINLPLRLRKELLAQASSSLHNSRNDLSRNELLSQTPLPDDPQWINPPSVTTGDACAAASSDAASQDAASCPPGMTVMTGGACTAASCNVAS